MPVSLIINKRGAEKMLIRKDDVKIAEKKEFMGGKNSIFMNVLLDLPLFTGAGRVYNKVVIPPKCSLGYHVHKNDSEAYYILEGSGLYNDNGEIVEVSAGDLTFTPDGCGHAMENNTDKNLVMLACVLFNFEKDKDAVSLRKIKKNGTLTKIDMHEPFGGKGDSYAHKLLEGDEFLGAGRLYNIVTFPPKCSIGYHTHTGESETYYVLKGKGIFNDDGVETEVSEGDVMYTGPGHSHGLANASDEDLVISALIMFDKESK